MKDNVLGFAPHRGGSLTWSAIKSDASELCSYCLMILEQVGNFATGFPIDLARNYPPVTVQQAQSELKERGYPTTYTPGVGERNFGQLVFQ